MIFTIKKFCKKNSKFKKQKIRCALINSYIGRKKKYKKEISKYKIYRLLYLLNKLY